MKGTLSIGSLDQQHAEASRRHNSSMNGNKENAMVPFTQEEEDCVEWEEGSDVDLRQVARSPHVSLSLTPAALHATQQTPRARPLAALKHLRRNLETSSLPLPSSSNLNTTATQSKTSVPLGSSHPNAKTYSAEQEVDGLFDMLQEEDAHHLHHESNDTNSVQADAPTQPQGNVPFPKPNSKARPQNLMTTEIRHRRKRREATQLRHDKPKRSSSADNNLRSISNAGRTRRHLKNAGGLGATDLFQKETEPTGTLNCAENPLDFETLLQQLDTNSSGKIQRKGLAAQMITTPASILPTRTIAAHQKENLHSSSSIPTSLHPLEGNNNKGMQPQNNRMAPPINRYRQVSHHPKTTCSIPVDNIEGGACREFSEQKQHASKASVQHVPPINPHKQQHPHVQLRSLSVEDNQDVQPEKRKGPNYYQYEVKAKECPIQTEQLLTTSASSLSNENSSPLDNDFGDLPDFSEADFASMDALVPTVTHKGTDANYLEPINASSRTKETSKNYESHYPTAPILPQSMNGNPGSSSSLSQTDAKKTIQPPNAVSYQQQQSKPLNDFEDDPFGDMPTIDFDAMDKKIAERSTSSDLTESKDVVDHNLNFGHIGTKKFSTNPPPMDTAIRNKCVADEGSNVGFLAFTRYKVVRVLEDPAKYTKTIIVASWSTAMIHEGDNKSMHQPETIRSKHQVHHQPTEEDGDGCIFLRDEWFHSHIYVGDIIHLCSLSGRYRTEVAALPVLLHTNSAWSDDLVLILHPDLLVTPTLISETIGCSRRAVLKSRLGSSGLTAKAALYGTMRHGLFERCMTSNNFTIKTAKHFTKRIVRDFAESLVGCGVTDTEAQREVLRVLPQLQRFAMDYTSFDDDKRASKNTTGATLEGQGAVPSINFVARSVHATEASAVSPELGLKGNVDVTVEAETWALQRTSSDLRQKSLMSVELKTGHNQTPQTAHMAQLALYTVMLRVQQGSNILDNTSKERPVVGSDSGMLLYLNHQSHSAVHIAPKINEIKSLIGQRNIVATEMKRAARPRGVLLSYDNDIGGREGTSDQQTGIQPSVNLLPAPPAALPEVLSASGSCARCYTNRECMMYAGAELSSEPASKALHGVDKTHGPLLHHFVGHLNDNDMKYFREWDRLIDLEADANTLHTSEAWLVSSADREKSSGKCISSLVFDEVASMAINPSLSGTKSETAADVLDSTVLIALHRSTASELKTPLSSLKIEAGSHVVLSTDATSFHLSSHISIATLDAKRKRPRLFRHRMHVVRGVMASVEDNTVTIRSSWRDLQEMQKLIRKHKTDQSNAQSCSRDGHELLFRLDKDEVSSGTGTLRQNLVNMFTCDAEPFLKKKEPTLHIQSQSQKEFSSDKTNTENPLRGRMVWLRDAVIRLRPPVYNHSLTKSMFNSRNKHLSDDHLSIPGCDFMDLAVEFAELNPDQRNAVNKVISAKDYSLIQGLPGTGKTSTIAFVARLLAAQGKRVLISSYTHAAVDNLMTKLMEKGLGATTKTNYLSALVRVGRKSACHPGVHSILVETIAAAREKLVSPSAADLSSDRPEEKEGGPTAENLSFVVSSAQIVGVSALTIPRSPLLIGQHFDVVILDEAGQISQPAVLGALMAADSFILVGDHMQLPPLVTSQVAEKGGYGISMLKRLAEAFPQAVAQLTLQYRMHGEICQLCNDIIYKGKLKCANDDVRYRLLDLPLFPTALATSTVGKGNESPSGWLHDAIDPSKPVVFLDTDVMQVQPRHGLQELTDSALVPDKGVSSQFQGLERTLGNIASGSIVNDTEVALVRRIVHGLLKCGLEASAIGIICPFRAQLRLFDECHSFQHWKKSGIEFSTIDRYQGRDKQVIILSFTRSNTKGKSGRLLDDFRRLNVAVSRAKRKMIMVGSFQTLHKGSDVLRPLLDGMRQRKAVKTLPEHALEQYTL